MIQRLFGFWHSGSVLPSALTRNVTGNWPTLGPGWLERLPALVDEISADWHLRVEQRYPMSFHWVAAVRTADGTPAVLKLGVPDGHLDAEAEALRIFDGDGAVRLLAEDRARGALLEERAAPGETLATLVPHRDEEATGVQLAVARRLHRVPPEKCTLPHLRSYREDLDDPRSLPRDLVARAAGLFDELCASSPGDVVLHGDLHHGNILSGPHAPGWLAIDPHGLVGDPGFDVGAMLYNPDPGDRDAGLLALVPRRVEQLAADHPMERVVAWGFVMGVLSSVWSGTAGSRAFDVARSLEPRLS